MSTKKRPTDKERGLQLMTRAFKKLAPEPAEVCRGCALAVLNNPTASLDMLKGLALAIPSHRQVPQRAAKDI